MDSIWLEIVLILVAIVANGFFSGAEIALVSSRVSRLAQMRDEGMRGAAVAMQLKEKPDTFLATIQIAITAAGTLASAVGGVTAVEALTPSLVALGLGRWAELVALGIVILAITYVSLVVGELAPKAIALRDPERIAAAMAPIIATASRWSSKLVALLTWSTTVLLRLLGLGADVAPPFTSEEDVRYLVREGAAKGIFEKGEEELVHNVFDLADTTVREIMTPRLSIQGIDIETPPAEILAAAATTGHSRLPVYRGSPEHTLGVVTLKDVVRVVAEGLTPELPALLRPPLFVPEAARISALLHELQRARQGLAFVVDEYGTIVGLVTVEDVVEEIVGEIRDEDESAPSLITRLPDGSVLVDGMAPVDEVERMLGILLPQPRDYATVAGFILATLNSVPSPGASLTAAGRRWTVMEMNGPRIRRIQVRPE
jgi:putative hemolysin